MFMRYKQTTLHSEITRLHEVIGTVEERNAQKNDAISQLKVRNARLKAAVVAKFYRFFDKVVI